MADKSKSPVETVEESRDGIVEKDNPELYARLKEAYEAEGSHDTPEGYLIFEGQMWMAYQDAKTGELAFRPTP
jgi:hypothetical protein